MRFLFKATFFTVNINILNIDAYMAKKMQGGLKSSPETTPMRVLLHTRSSAIAEGPRDASCQFFKNQDGGGSYLEKQQKSRYHNNGLADPREIWHDYAKWVS